MLALKRYSSYHFYTTPRVYFYFRAKNDKGLGAVLTSKQQEFKAALLQGYRDRNVSLNLGEKM